MAPIAPRRREEGGTVANWKTSGVMLALLMLVSPGMAATVEDESLAKDLVVCNAKFAGLAIFVTGKDGAEDLAKASYAAWWAATSLAGADFVNREREEATSQVMDWLVAKDGHKPTREAAMKTCLPLMKRALAVIASKHPDEAP